MHLPVIVAPEKCVPVSFIDHYSPISYPQAFKKLDPTKRGYITTSEVGKFYCAYKHPSVQTGESI